MAKKILIVDDEREWVKLFAMRLESEGYQVDVAFDAIQAKIQVVKSKPDLVLLDIMMPAGGGISVLKNIRMSTKTFNLPVIIATARMDNQIKETAEKLDVSGYFLKPVDMGQLMQKVRKIFGEEEKNTKEEDRDVTKIGGG